MIYNDAYADFAGSRHPHILGKPVLEGWHEVADFNRRVMDVGLRRRDAVVSRQAPRSQPSRRTGGRLAQPRLQPRAWTRPASRLACWRSWSTRRPGCMPSGLSARASRASAPSPTTSRSSPGWPTRTARSSGTTSAGSTTRHDASMRCRAGAGARCITPTTSTASSRRSPAALPPGEDWEDTFPLRGARRQLPLVPLARPADPRRERQGRALVRHEHRHHPAP